MSAFERLGMANILPMAIHREIRDQSACSNPHCKEPEIGQGLEVNYRRYNRGGKHQYQPLQIVSREETGEVQDQDGDGDQVINCK